MLNVCQECPRCSGAIAPENCVVENLVIYEVTYLYCEFCQLGIETMFKIEGDRRYEKVRCEMDGKVNPRGLRNLIQRMRTSALVSHSRFTSTVGKLRKALAPLAA